MQWLYYLAAFLLVAVAVAHSYLGERFILTRLFKRDNLPKLFGSDNFTKRTLRFAWHVTSVAWLGFAAIIIALAQAQPDVQILVKIIAATFAIHFAISFFGSAGEHLSWIVFGAVSILLVL